MRLRRSDFLAITALVLLVHALLLIGEVRRLPFRLNHFSNAALLFTNLYFVYSGFLVSGLIRTLRLVFYPLGYLALLYVFFLYNVDWRPLFFPLAIVYSSIYRLPAALGLFVIFILSHVFAQPHPWAAFIVVGSVFAVAYTVHRKAYGWFHVTAIAFGLAAFGLLLFPIVCFVLLDSPQTILETFAQSEVALAIKTSLLSATICTLIVLLFGVPLAYGLARARFRGKSFLETVIDLPILIPQSAVGVAFLWIVGAKGILGGVVNIPGTLLGVILAQMFVSAPFLIKTAITSFEAVHPRLESVARSLGASPAGAFWRVSLPLAARGIFVGCILTWSRAISEVGSVALLAYYPMTASVLVFSRSTQAGIEQARPVAIVLILTCLWVFVGLHFIRSAAFKRFVVGAEQT
jgi:molybdate/tungstate transport system permease protein